MALPQDFLDELHDRNEIVDVIGSYVELRKRGRLYTGLCPFHTEKTPSFTIYPDTQNYYCFGCGNGGDVITFIKNYENLDYIEAVRLLSERAGMKFPDDTSDREENLKKRILEANRLAARFFFETLKSDEGLEARKYLRRRGLTDETITRFGIGYAPDSWDKLRNYLRSKGYSDRELIEGSLCSQGSKSGCFDYFRARVMFPVIDVRGQIVAFSGRTMSSDKNMRKYFNSKDTPAFKKSKIVFGLNFAKNAGTKRVILVEGQMDVITLHQAGFTEAVATLGTAITEEHAKLLSRFANEVLVCYDSDAPGQKATRRAIDTLRAADVPVRVISIEGGKDPDELIREKGSSAFKAALDKASGSVEYELMKAKQQFRMDTQDGKVGYLNSVIPILARCQNLTEREVWAIQVSAETGVDKQTILTTVQRQIKKQINQENAKKEKQFPNSITDKLKLKSYEREKVGSVAAERRLVAAVFLNPDFSKKISERITGSDFVSSEMGKIYDVLVQQIRDNAFNGFSSVASVLSSQESSLLSGSIAENSGIDFTPEDADYYADKILEQKDKQRLEVRTADPDELMKALMNKKHKQ